jgi:hypothetical protein
VPAGAPLPGRSWIAGEFRRRRWRSAGGGVRHRRMGSPPNELKLPEEKRFSQQHFPLGGHPGSLNPVDVAVADWLIGVCRASITP